MHNARVTNAELETVVRTAGKNDMASIGAVILESDGSFSVIESKLDENDEII